MRACPTSLIRPKNSASDISPGPATPGTRNVASPSIIEAITWACPPAPNMNARSATNAILDRGDVGDDGTVADAAQRSLHLNSGFGLAPTVHPKKQVVVGVAVAEVIDVAVPGTEIQADATTAMARRADIVDHGVSGKIEQPDAVDIVSRQDLIFALEYHGGRHRGATGAILARKFRQMIQRTDGRICGDDGLTLENRSVRPNFPAQRKTGQCRHPRPVAVSLDGEVAQENPGPEAIQICFEADWLVLGITCERLLRPDTNAGKGRVQTVADRVLEITGGNAEIVGDHAPVNVADLLEQP